MSYPKYPTDKVQPTRHFYVHLEIKEIEKTAGEPDRTIATVVSTHMSAPELITILEKAHSLLNIEAGYVRKASE